jgi:hypothetical protein
MSLLAGEKRFLTPSADIFSAPPSTAYTMKSTFADAYVKEKDSHLLGIGEKDGPGNYLYRRDWSGPSSSAYYPDSDECFNKPPSNLKDKHVNSSIYRANPQTKPTFVSKESRWEDTKLVKESVGPGRYDPSYTLIDKSRTMVFPRGNRPDLAFKSAYNPPPEVNSNDKSSSASTDDTNISIKTLDAILNKTHAGRGQKAGHYKPKGFGSSVRFPNHDKGEKRVKIPSKYSDLRSNNEINLPSTFAQDKGYSFGTSPQHVLFHMRGDERPGPGAHSPVLPDQKVPTNVRLGRRLPIAGGKGTDGMCIGDNFTHPKQINNVKLIEDCTDLNINEQMAKYRDVINTVARTKKLPPFEEDENGEINASDCGGRRHDEKESAEDVKEARSSLETLERKMFFSKNCPEMPKTFQRTLSKSMMMTKSGSSASIVVPSPATDE